MEVKISAIKITLRTTTFLSFLFQRWKMVGWLLWVPKRVKKRLTGSPGVDYPEPRPAIDVSSNYCDTRGWKSRFWKFTMSVFRLLPSIFEYYEYCQLFISTKGAQFFFPEMGAWFLERKIGVNGTGTSQRHLVEFVRSQVVGMNSFTLSIILREIFGTSSAKQSERWLW